MSSYVIDGGTLKNIADAIRAKTGDGGTLTPGDMPEAIGSISGGGGGEPTAPAGDVTFIDCDGTIRYSYTAAEFAALDAMPDNPTHDGLVAQGWNWSLADAKSYVAKYGRLTIGQMYITDDGTTRLYIHIATSGRMTVPLYWSQTVDNGVSIDWGDGSSAFTASDTGNNNTTHTYAAPGDYVITLTPTDGCTLGLGAENTSYCVMGSTGNTNKVYCNMLRKAEIGNGVTSIGSSAFYGCYLLSQVTIPDGVTSIETSAFYGCYLLSQVTIPDSVTSIGQSAFQNCYSLAQITIPDGVISIGSSAFGRCYSLPQVTIPDSVTSIGSNAFQTCDSLSQVTIPDSVTSIESSAFYGCASLSRITIPDGVISIGSSAFYNCYSLAQITIPDNVTSIGGSAFYNCYSLGQLIIPNSVTSIESKAFYSCYGVAEYHLLPTTPPTLASNNAFTPIPSDCIIYVPQGSLEAYQTATNWSSYASKMREE